MTDQPATPPPLPPLCECGCGQPIPTPPYGGYIATTQRSVWFASNPCYARWLQTQRDKTKKEQR